MFRDYNRKDIFQMDKAYNDHISLYFCQKNKIAAFLLILLGVGIWAIGFSKKDIYIFIVVGGLFCTLGIWIFLKELHANVSGQEVDNYVLNYYKYFPLRERIYNYLELSEKDVEEKEAYSFYGYTTKPIYTEPLLRIDTNDKKARASNIQISYFMFDDEVLINYSQIKSLTDSEFREKKYVWSYRSIKYCELSSVKKMCMTAPGKNDDKEEGVFNVMTIIDKDNLTYKFAFDERFEVSAKYISKRIRKKIYLNID